MSIIIHLLIFNLCCYALSYIMISNQKLGTRFTDFNKTCFASTDSGEQPLQYGWMKQVIVNYVCELIKNHDLSRFSFYELLFLVFSFDCSEICEIKLFSLRHTCFHINIESVREVRLIRVTFYLLFQPRTFSWVVEKHFESHNCAQ